MLLRGCALCRMVRIIADEFLTEERDRKYYADHYTCCPPPLFILLITLIEVSQSLIALLAWRPRPSSRILSSDTCLQSVMLCTRYLQPFIFPFFSLYIHVNLSTPTHMNIAVSLRPFWFTVLLHNLDFHLLHPFVCKDLDVYRMA